jgi:steroid delta-isomerase-like uncharacterized protein
MSIEENKKVMQRIYDEFLNAGNLDAADALMAADIIEHEESHRAAPGLAGTKHIIATFRSAFPDLHFRVEDMIAEGDQVVTRVTMRGTHRSEFMGIPPTGKKFEVQTIDIVRFAGGKAAEHWAVSDNLGMMQQLGVVPTPGQGGA